MQIWTRADAAALCALVDATMPGEQLSADEIVSACFEHPDRSIVLALPDGTGAVAAVIAGAGDERVAHIVLLAVEPSGQGRGHGRRLLAAAAEWAFDDLEVTELHAGAGSPFGLWPGVDVRWTRSLCLFQAAGYEARGSTLTLSCPSTCRAVIPSGVAVRRVLEDADAAAALAWSGRHLPSWVGQVGRAVEHGCCLLAVTGEVIAGVACHSVNRAGWIGPLAVTPEHRRRGIGRALLGAACADLREAGWPDVQISPSSPLEFFARSAGASVSRVFVSFVRSRPDRDG